MKQTRKLNIFATFVPIMTNEYQIRVLPEVAAQQEQLKHYLADEYALRFQDITSLRILKRSIDARQRTIFVNLKVRVYVNELPTDDEYQYVDYPDVSDCPQVIVVGAGPGGLFAALRLIELGVRPIVLERGKDVHERKKDLAAIGRTQLVDGESNYCFGEGGAGAYSDGKLYTRSKKRGNIEKILNVFCQHGASTAILADAHPHIGTDRLPKVIEAMRNTIIRCGGEVHFQTKMTRFILEGDRVVGVEAEIVVVIADIAGHLAGDFLEIDVGLGGDFTGKDDEIGGCERFAGDARFRILRKQGVENGVGYLVADFVRMAFGNRFRCKNLIF